MKRLVSRAFLPAWKLVSRRRMLALPILFLLTAVAVSAAIALFRVYSDDTGRMQTSSSNPTTLNATNPFFDPSIGTNGQACVTCHEPQTGITITPPFIREKFEESNGTDPLFRPNDTANNPQLPLSKHTRDDYSVFLALGTPRIGELVQQSATPNDFTVVADAASNAKFAAPDMFPLHTDPQHPGLATLSIFRRPLVNTNVNFDSSVLWDGRADISRLSTQQVPGAIKSLLLGTGADPTVNQAIVDFMTGVYTDQVADNAAGDLDAHGATGGVNNLIALAQSSSRPCVNDEDSPTPDITPFVEAVATPISCTPVVGGGPNFILFQAWENLPTCQGGEDDCEAQNARASIGRGEVIFNTPKGKCTACHSVNNLGNNPSAAFMIKEGHDSIAKLQAIQAAAAASSDANAAEEAERIQDMIDRVSLLPSYCLRPTSDTSGTTCGTDAVDVVTTDPARALVTGLIKDTGKQKPPTLRNLSVRAPFFHNGDAVDMQHLVTFYKFFLNLTLTPSDERDLINFLNAL
jgi:cytochrome c peroxidase